MSHPNTNQAHAYANFTAFDMVPNCVSSLTLNDIFNFRSFAGSLLFSLLPDESAERIINRPMAAVEAGAGAPSLRLQDKGVLPPSPQEHPSSNNNP